MLTPAERNAVLEEAVRLLHMLDRPEARHPDVAAFLDAYDALPAAPQEDAGPRLIPETEALCLEVADAIRHAGWDLAGQTVMAVIQGLNNLLLKKHPASLPRVEAGRDAALEEAVQAVAHLPDHHLVLGRAGSQRDRIAGVVRASVIAAIRALQTRSPRP